MPPFEFVQTELFVFACGARHWILVKVIKSHDRGGACCHVSKQVQFSGGNGKHGLVVKETQRAIHEMNAKEQVDASPRFDKQSNQVLYRPIFLGQTDRYRIGPINNNIWKTLIEFLVK